MSRGITTAASTSPDLTLATAWARVGTRTADLAEAAAWRTGSTSTRCAADLDGLAGRRFVDDRHPRLRRAARDRQPDQQRDRDRVDDQHRDQQPRAAQDQQVLASSQRIGQCPRSARKATNAASKSSLAALALAAISSAGRAVEQQLAVGEHDHARGVARAPRRRWCVENSTLVPRRLGASAPTNSHSRSRWRGIERRGGLVEREHRRVGDQPERDVHALAVAAGQALHALVGAIAAARSARACAPTARVGVGDAAPGARTAAGSPAPTASSRAAAAAAPSRSRARRACAAEP